MENKELIMSLLQQNMRHSRLINGLENIGLEMHDGQTLNLQSIIARLMEIPKDEASDQWGGIYQSFMEEAGKLEISENRKEFEPLAVQCYEQLSACLKIQMRVCV